MSRIRRRRLKFKRQSLTVDLTADIGDWTTPVPVTRDITTFSRSHIQQPGSRIFYISTAGGIGAAQDAAGEFYVWNGTALEDQTGSTTGAGGVAYGTDPFNPTGPIKPYSRWAYVGPTRNGNEIGRAWGGANNNVGAERFNKTNRYQSPDWWLFKRGDTFDLSLDVLSHAQETTPGTTSISDTSLAVPGGASVGAEQVVGAYGPTSTARPRFTHPQGGGFFSRSLPSGTEAHCANIRYLGLHFDGHDRATGTNWVQLFSGANEFTNVIWEDIWADGTQNLNIQNSYTGQLKFRRCIWGDHWTSANANTEGIFFSGADTTARLTIEDSISYRNAFRDGFDPQLFWPPVVSPAAVTLTIASPCVATKTAHGKVLNDPIQFTTTGSLPTGVTRGTRYYVIATGLTADNFQFSTSVGGAAVNTSGSQSGTHHMDIEWNIFDRNFYMSGTCDHANTFFTNNVSLLGASGDQFRSGFMNEGNFYYTGYVANEDHGGDSTAIGGSFKNNVVQLFQPGHAAHHGGGPGFDYGAHDFDVSGNITTRAQCGSGNFALSFQWTNQALSGGEVVADPYNKIQNITVTDNIFDAGSSSYAIDMLDGNYDPLFFWTNPGIQNNTVNNNTFIYQTTLTQLTKQTGIGSGGGSSGDGLRPGKARRYNAGVVDNTHNDPCTSLAVVGTPPNENWLLTATSATNFTVVGSVSGAQADATVGTPYSNPFHSFTLTDQGLAFVAGDTVQFKSGVTVSNDTTSYSGNSNYTSRALAATAKGWTGQDRTLKTYLQSRGVTVTSTDGVTEYIDIVATMRRGQWRYDMTAQAIVNYFREGFGMSAI